MLRKIEKCMIRIEWITLLNNAQSITWIYCPGHAGVKGNERADVLAGKALVNGTEIRRDRIELIRAVMDTLREDDEKVERDNVHILRMVEMGVTRGDGRKCSLSGKIRRTRNQQLTGTLIRWLTEWQAEHIWECPQCCYACS